MNKLFIALAALISVQAYATPKVGDFAEFDTVLSLNGQQVTGSITLEIIQQNDQNQFLRRETVVFPGQDTQTEEIWINADELINDATIDNVLANCATSGGALQTISVPAGEFQTCALPSEGEDSKDLAYVAKVPFGIAQYDSLKKANGMLMQLKLKSFR